MDNKEYDTKYKKAKEHYEKENYEEALKLFNELNEVEESAECLNGIGMCYFDLGEQDMAISKFRYLIKEYSDWEIPTLNLGRVYLKLGDMEKAFSCFNEVIFINPDSEDGYFYLSVYYYKIGEYEKEKEYLRKSIELNHEQPEAHQNMGLCLFREEKYEKALEEFNISFNLCEDDEVFYSIGLTYKALKKYDKALNTFLKFLDLYPGDIECMQEISSCHYLLNEFQKAKEWNDKILELEPEHEEALYNNAFEEAEAHYRESNFAQALKLFSELNDKKESDDCLNYMGLCNMHLEQYKNAMFLFQYLIKKCPDWERPVFNLGRVYHKLGIMEEALSYLKKAVLIKPDSEDGYYYLGIYYSKLGNYEIARRYHEKSININYNQPETHQNIGICFSYEKQYEKALEEFQISYKLYQDDQVLYSIGLTYMSLNSYDEALKIFYKLYNKNPDDIECIKEIVRCYIRQNNYIKAAEWNDKVLELQPNYDKALALAEKLKQRIAEQN